MDIYTKIVLGILSISTIISTLEVTGLISLIPWLGKKIRRARVDTTLDVLKEMGVDMKGSQSALTAFKIKRPVGNFKTDTENLIKASLNHNVTASVGKTSPVLSKGFWDVMGSTTAEASAISFAKTLTSKWRDALQSHEISKPMIDFVVTPKDGSPILGYEFSKIIGKPFALYSDHEKFSTTESEFKFFTHFDMHFKPQPGSVALLVDDSTTGGRKVENTIKCLRSHGYIVEDCLVVFEPTIKKTLPRDLLQSQNVKLHSIIQKAK